MVKTVRMAAFALASLVCFAGCNLGAGIFPDRLMSYEAFADLDRFIDRDHVGNYNFEIIRDSRPTSGYPEYIVLATDDGSFGDDCVVIFDADLKVLGHYTLSQLDDMNTANPFSGWGAMVDKTGCIVVGNRRFSVSSRKVTYLDVPGFTLYHYGLAVPDAPDPNLANIRGEGSNLRFERYNADWVFMAPMSLQFSGLPSHEILGAWLTATDVLLVVRHDPDPDTAHVLKMNDLMFATGGLTPALITGGGGYANTVPSCNDIEWDTLGYTSEGFAAFRRWPIPQYYLFNEFGAEIGVVSEEIPEGKRPYNQRHVYGRTSGWYIMDMKEMSIERRAWWWK
jgi:hypothetical protein